MQEPTPIEMLKARKEREMEVHSNCLNVLMKNGENFIDLENGVAAFSQKDYELKRHSHFPFEIVFPLSGHVDIGTRDRLYQDIGSAAVNSNVPHTYKCYKGECQLFFIDPVSVTGRQIRNIFFNQDQELVSLNDMSSGEFIHTYLLNKNSANNTFFFDRRIEECILWINENFASENMNISEIASKIFLSESRLSHLFKLETGISIRQYILWKKIELAVTLALDGESLTQCSYATGFADSSHFIRTFQKMFGIYPSFAIKK